MQNSFKNLINQRFHIILNSVFILGILNFKILDIMDIKGQKQ